MALEQLHSLQYSRSRVRLPAALDLRTLAVTSLSRPRARLRSRLSARAPAHCIFWADSIKVLFLKGVQGFTGASFSQITTCACALALEKVAVLSHLMTLVLGISVEWDSTKP